MSSPPLLRTTLSLISLQLVSRLFSFSLNQVLLRSTTPQALGVATLSLEVIRDTGLFFLREGLRGAIVRNQQSTTKTSNNLLQQTMLLPTLLSPLVTPLYLLYSFYPPTPFPSHFQLTLSLYFLSTLLELFAEPYYLLTLQSWETQTSRRVKVEGVAVGAKSIATLATILVGGEDWALASYGVGQVVYASMILVGLRWSAGGTVGMSIKQDREGNRFDKGLTRLSWALTKQSIIKQVLTEGDKVVVGRLGKVSDQGGYALALNYGSLLARILFQPLEESSRLFFSRSLSSPTPSSLLATASHLTSLLTLHCHLSLIFILLAPSYTSPLVHHLLGQRWNSQGSSVGKLLGDYCAYLAFMGFNGVTEAFFQSVAEGQELNWGNAAMGTSVLGAGAHLVLMRAFGEGKGGGSEVIWANCTNLAIRIAFSSWFIRRYYIRHSTATSPKVSAEQQMTLWTTLYWRSWTPSPGTVGTFYLSYRLVTWSEKFHDWTTMQGLLRHGGVGAVCGIACVIVSGMAQRGRLRGLLREKGSKEDVKVKQG